ncbi:prolipoprotein diacylglyceryl transferase [Candidatus Curtissbacteria bacterium RBG_16_39_7]|uniref:Phosphatidylglycerol--prolipoprotein diacylglyceryl transferase n=1 Tax=Candidatus Curtissbacteria bacterium RBG_16_39_7 TaxID=1797707 RepID=A0A1F5G1V2_9BACT|nr:MAG: prolipoprotein diacylglyceryl transferase [Candidatus Curtissbacteria bacterium RBG_16_39_7]
MLELFWMPSSFSLGFFSIHPYGLVVTLALLVGFLFIYYRVSSFKIKKENILDLPLILVIPVLFGARIYHVLDYWDFYRSDPSRIIAFWQGGLGIWGALIFGFLAVVVWARMKKIKILPLLDLLAPGVILTQSIGRLGNFFNLEAFGPPTTLPWKIYIPPSNRPSGYPGDHFFHPTFFYEAIVNFFIFLTLIFLAGRLKKIPGLIFFLYVMLYSLGRFGLEFLRVDTWSVGGLKVAQILAFLAIFAAWFFILRPRPFGAKRKDFLSFK